MVRRRAMRSFTLFEMLITISVIASIAVLTSPLLLNDDRLRVMAASSVLASDIEMAQMTSIAQPYDTVVVRFEPSRNTYWLASAFDTETPITRPDDGRPYLVEFGVGRASGAEGVSMSTLQMPGNIISFNPHGGIDAFMTEPMIELTCGEQIMSIQISPMTGLVTEIDGKVSEPAPAK